MTSGETMELNQLNTRLRGVWRRQQSLHLFVGALALLQWFIPIILVCIFIDWMTYMPTTGRLAMLLALISVSLFQVWRTGWRHLRSFESARTALQLESHLGGLQSLFVSAIQLSGQTADTTSQVLSRRTCNLAEAEASQIQPGKVVPFHALGRPAILTSLLLGCLGVFAIINGTFLAVGFARILTPWIQIEYPTKTQINLPQQELVVKEGDPAKITASLSGVIPKQAILLIRTGVGDPREIAIDVAEGQVTYQLATASRNFSYRIKAGDDRTDWMPFRVITSPRITKVDVDLIYPDYIERETETVQALTLTIPEGTDLRWNFTLDRPIQSAECLLDGKEPLPLQLSSDGQSVAFTTDISASLGYHFNWIEKEKGFEFDSPRYFLQVAADQAPRVEFVSPETNLVAMLGRPLTLKVRAQDDHGIGSSQITYRVNQLEEKAIDLQENLRIGQGEQTLPWDYRDTLPDLQIGDTVSFSVCVSDRYPGEEGSHVFRSEARRITFLSKEQYLEQINEKRDRLLSRVLSIYRQERYAHEIVRQLPANSTGYLQTCQLEAIRQEMIREQLHEVANQVQSLLDDMAANKVEEGSETQLLESIREQLNLISETFVARAANQLREQSADTSVGNPVGTTESAATINTAARELASLVLIRGIESAQEVYARETRMLAQVQAEIRWRASTPTERPSTAIIDLQNSLADWTERLLDDMQNKMQYKKRPLTVLRLLRNVKNLVQSGTTSEMRLVSSMIHEEDYDEASQLQTQLISRLLDAEFSVRLSGAYATLIDTRDLVRSMVTVQRRCIADQSELSEDAFAKELSNITGTQKALRRQLLSLLLPTVPAPRAALFDEVPPEPPPVIKLVQTTDQAMMQALENFESSDYQRAIAQQTLALKHLTQLSSFIDRWAVQMGLQTQGLSTLVAASSEQMARLEECEARTIALLDKTDLAALDNHDVSTLAGAQENLASDVGGFTMALKRQDQQETNPDLPPLLTRLAAAEVSLTNAIEALQKNQPEKALRQQEDAADTLANAFELVRSQNERLTLLQDMVMFQRSVSFANDYMRDMVNEQRELLEATEASTAAGLKSLQPRFTHLLSCMRELAPLLDLVAARMDVGTPLAFAQTDFEDALAAIEIGDQFEAVDAQDVAAESLAEVQAGVEEIVQQTTYLAEIVEYLHQSGSDAATLSHQQTELRSDLISAQHQTLVRFIQNQNALTKQAENQEQGLLAAAGSPKLFPNAESLSGLLVNDEAVSVLQRPSLEMRKVSSSLEQNDALTAADQMELIPLLYSENAEALLNVSKMLHGLPQVEITSDSQPELRRLVDVLAIASDHKRIFRATQATITEDKDNTDNTQELSKQQQDVANRLTGVLNGADSALKLKEASNHLRDALDNFAEKERSAVRQSQKSADRAMRHFIIEQALILETDLPPAAASDAPAADGPGSDNESDVTAGFIADFVSGETPKDQRSEWKVLAERERAALNQNFARELPLEYRSLLKNYYQRVAR